MRADGATFLSLSEFQIWFSCEERKAILDSLLVHHGLTIHRSDVNRIDQDEFP